MIFRTVDCMLYWPTRAMIKPFTSTFCGPTTRNRQFVVSLEYHPVIKVHGWVIPSLSWTRINFNFESPFNGEWTDFYKWACTENGNAKLIDDVVGLQNLLIDHLKASLPFNENIQNIRHFGPAEWPYLQIKSGGNIVREIISPALRSQEASTPLEINLERFKDGQQLPITIRGISRACDLVECGYPTEALLICTAMLDDIVQKILMEGMGAVGINIDSAQKLLRNTMQARLSTYLDPVLKLIYGRSLKEDNSDLFNKIQHLNRKRNDAIHNGIEVKRTEARDACKYVFDVIDYLNSVGSVKMEMTPRPVFPIY